MFLSTKRLSDCVSVPYSTLIPSQNHSGWLILCTRKSPPPTVRPSYLNLLEHEDAGHHAGPEQLIARLDRAPAASRPPQPPPWLKKSGGDDFSSSLRIVRTPTTGGHNPKQTGVTVAPGTIPGHPSQERDRGSAAVRLWRGRTATLLHHHVYRPPYRDGCRCAT